MPIQFAERVIPLGQVYGANPVSGTGLTLYQGRELLVLDIDRLVFSSPASALPQLPAAASASASANARLSDLPEVVAAIAPSNHPANHPAPSQNNHCLLILQNDRHQCFGLALSSQPALLRVAATCFMPVPPEYLATGAIRCISALVVPHPDEPPLFLLNLNSLLQ